MFYLSASAACFTYPHFARVNPDDWRLVEELVAEPLPGRLALLDVDADPRLDLMRLETGFPGIRVDTVHVDELAFNDWWMVGQTEGEPGLADLSGDGLPDLIAVGAGGSSLAWIERRNLRPAAPRGLYVGPGMGLEVADFDLDSRPDVVVTGTTIGQIPVHMMFRPQGQGLFGAQSVALPAHERTDQVALGDFTGNRGTDVVSLEADGSLRCFPALGRSTYGPSLVSQLSSPALQLAGLRRSSGTALAAALLDTGEVSVVVADERCQLVELERESPPDGGRAIAVADADDDGQLDLFVTTELGSVAVYSASLSSNFTLGQTLELELSDPTGLAAADIDGDGWNDLLAAGPDGVMVVFDAFANGFGEPEVAIIDGSPATEVIGADLNGDGLGEVIVVGGGDPARIYWVGESSGETAGDLEIRREILDDWTADLTAPKIADIDGDIDLDILTLDPSFGAVVWRNGAAP